MTQGHALHLSLAGEPFSRLQSLLVGLANGREAVYRAPRKACPVLSDRSESIELHNVAGPAGIEPTTTGLKARCSILAELRAPSRHCLISRFKG